MQHQEHILYVGMHDGVCTVTSADGGETWHQGKTTPLAHAAARLSVSPAAPHHAYLAAYEAGVYRTRDGGLTWQHLSSYPSDYAHSVLMHPEEAGTVYVGSEPATIFRSQDDGKTWQECEAFRTVPEAENWFFHSETRQSHVRDLRIAPHNPSCLYAGIEVGGVVGSRDGAASWRQLPGTHDDIHCIDLSAARPQTLYVATARGPYRSDDEGQHWELINEGLQRPYTLHIAAAPDNADVVLVTVSRNAGRKEPQFYRSATAGQSWELVDGLGSGDDMVVAFDWDPIDPERVYAGTGSGKLYRSQDRGMSWEPIPVELSSVAVGALAIGPGASAS